MLHFVYDNVITFQNTRESFPFYIIKTTLILGDNDIHRCYEFNRGY